MANTIRTQIIANLITRAADIRTTKGFLTDVGTNQFRGVKPGKKIPAVAISAGRETVTKESGANICEMPVDVMAYMALGTSEPEIVAEKILADLIEAFTGTEITFTFEDGESEIEVGDTITGATSGATGYVCAVSVSSGTWDGDDAAGTVTIRRDSGSFGAETVTVGGTNSAAITGATAEGPEDVSTGGLAASVVYAEGGAEDLPEGGETVVGCAARFVVKYRTKTGNPFSQI